MGVQSKTGSGIARNRRATAGGPTSSTFPAAGGKTAARRRTGGPRGDETAAHHAIVSSVIENSPLVIARWLVTAPRARSPKPSLEYISANVAQFGCDARELTAGKIEFLDGLVHADDRERVLAAIVRPASQRTGVVAIEFRIVRQGREDGWVEAHLSSMRDAGGAVRCYGLLRDVTERKHAERSLEFARKLAELEMESSPDAILVVNANKPADRNIESFNRRFIEMHAIPPELLESREDEPILQVAMSRTLHPDKTMERIRYLYEHPDQSSHEEVEMLDGRIIDRHSSSLKTETGEILGRVWFFRDVTEQRRAAAAVQAALERHQRQMQVVGAVGKGESLLSGDIEALTREITEQSARVMGCDRVCVWLFNEAENELHSVDMYEASSGTHLSGDILYEHDYREEFQALKVDGYIAADDPLAEPRLAGHAENYLKPYRVTAVLDAVVEVGGRHLGLVHFAHVDKPHHWEQDEITFARQLADKLGLGMLAKMRRIEENKLRASEAALAEAEGIAGLGSWTYDAANNTGTFSQEAYRILGVDPRTFAHTHEAYIVRVHPEDRTAFEQAFNKSIVRRHSFAMDYRIVLDDGTIKWVHDIAHNFYDADGRRIRAAGTMQDITERKHAEAALKRERDFSTALVDSLPNLFALIDEHGRLVQWNANLPALVGMTNDELRGLDAAAIVAEADRDAVRARFRAAFDNGVADVEFSVATGTRENRRIHINGRLIESDGRPYLLVIGVDLTEAREAALRLRESEERFHTIFDSVTDAIIVHDLESGHFLDVNRRLTEMFGYSRKEVLEQGLKLLMPGSYREAAEVATPLLKRAAAGEPQLFELLCKAKDGRNLWIEISLRRAEFSGRPVLLSTAHDITEHKAAHARISHLARYDGLTGLANRGVFMEGIAQAIVRARTSDRSFGVLYLDIDHFKDINDTLGHPVGDLLLISVARRLQAAARERDIVARLGGDEFAVIAADVCDPAELAVLANNLLLMLSEPHAIEGNEIRAGSSIGIDVYGPGSPDGEALLAHADLALYRAKSEGRGTYRFFTESMSIEVRRRVTLGADLREAIANDQLFLAYQPQVDSQTGRIVGVEALIRWRHPVQGLISPGEFIPVAEKNGLILALGQWVMREACRQMKAWLDAGIAPPLMAVNVSGVQFKAPLELEDEFNAILAETGLPAQCIELEFTESVLMDASRDHNEVLARFRERGMRIAIDDFGTGYSSLDYLSRFPVDRIKIAQTFIADLTSRSNVAIVRAAIGLASELGLDVLVEGAETANQVELVRSWGCRIMQGYYFARPTPAPEVEELLRAGLPLKETPSPDLVPLVPALLEPEAVYSLAP